MSYRGNRRHGNHDRRSHVHIPTREEALSNAILSFGDQPQSDLSIELEALVNNIREHGEAFMPTVTEAVKLGVTHHLHKLTHYAALVALLYIPLADTNTTATSPDPLGLQILTACWRYCKESMAEKSERTLRSWVQFISKLSVLNIIPSDSLLEFLMNISRALDELGASFGRILKTSLCICDGLLVAGSLLHERHPETVNSLVQAVIASMPDDSLREMISPVFIPGGEETIASASTGLFQELKIVLQTSLENGFQNETQLYLKPELQFPALTDSLVTPFQLDSVLLPPEELDTSSSALSSASDFQPYHINLFDDTMTPPRGTPHGFAIRSLITNMVEIYASNRKECARVLDSLPRWLDPTYFKTAHADGTAQNGSAVEDGKWQLQITLLETLIGGLLSLPFERTQMAYFTSLVSELCKLSPAPFGPAVGKCFRRLYGLVGEGLDVEATRRFGDWFSFHMSNFGFNWVWKEWIPDLELEVNHPKREFIRRVLGLEIRLAYFDRVLQSLPDVYQQPMTKLLPESAPGPDYAYGDPNHEYYSVAQEVMNWLQSRMDPTDVISKLEQQKEKLVDSGETDGQAMSILRLITVQSLLEIGSRSFSHFLNAIERYLKVMRFMSSDVDGGKRDILDAVGSFWGKNPQLLFITLDKIVQYQFVEPSDVLEWVFNTGGRRLDFSLWEIAKLALDKAVGRVIVSDRKVLQLEKEHDDAQAALKAQDAVDIEMESEARPDIIVTIPANLIAAREAGIALREQQRQALIKMTQGFLDCLIASPTVLEPEVWDQRKKWSVQQWDAYEVWGCYRQFCRSYATQIVAHKEQLDSLFDIKASEESEQKVQRIHRYWTMVGGSSDSLA